jgi:hypothetical protein
MQLNSISINANQGFSFSLLTNIGTDIWNSCLTYFNYIFSMTNFAWWKFVILIYILFAVGSSITLSPSDIQSSVSGFVYLVITLLIFNLTTFWIGDFTLDFFIKASEFLSGFYFLIILSIIINIGFIFILFFALLLKR